MRLKFWCCADKAVLQQTAMAQLQKPNPRDLRFLNEWLLSPDMGGVSLEGQDGDVWENPDRRDLIVLKARQNDSLLSAWMSDRLIHWYHQVIGFRLAVRVIIQLSTTSCKSADGMDT